MHYTVKKGKRNWVIECNAIEEIGKLCGVLNYDQRVEVKGLVLFSLLFTVR